jgi:glycerophosphoryl diester phosphodiesterase
MQTTDWPWARAIAHRGGGTLAPENTLAGIRTGIEHGYRAIEFDAMLASDEVPVLIHDHTLERTTSGSGLVPSQAAAALTALDAGRWFGDRFAGERLPTFAQAVEFCRGNGVWINIEIKPAPGFDARTGEVVARETARLYADVIRPGGGERGRIVRDVPLFSSFSDAALSAARRTAPDVPRGYLRDRVPPDWRDSLEDLRAVALHTNHKYLTREQAREIKDAGYWLFCYTVNDPARAREIVDWGVDAFCTDRIDLIPPDFI